MLTIYREDLTITANGPLGPAEGSYNVPVKLENEDNTYSGYNCYMYIGYHCAGIQKTRKIYAEETGVYLIPAAALAQNGPLFISFMFEQKDKTEGLMTNALTFIVRDAPSVVIETPIDPTWEELVKEWIKDIVDLSNYYTKEEINVGFNGIAEVITENQIENKKTFATKEEIDSKGYKTESEIRTIVNDVITEALNSEV